MLSFTPTTFDKFKEENTNLSTKGSANTPRSLFAKNKNGLRIKQYGTISYLDRRQRFESQTLDDMSDSASASSFTNQMSSQDFSALLNQDFDRKNEYEETILKIVNDLSRD
mmetsp:Transcript_42308/g.30985  ORF Transcript_42308/g.30985 Transcript_42308/m.30985 type:complete len:111 (+) Transcript_42308:112-444(+)